MYIFYTFLANFWHSIEHHNTLPITCKSRSGAAWKVNRKRHGVTPRICRTTVPANWQLFISVWLACRFRRLIIISRTSVFTKRLPIMRRQTRFLRPYKFFFLRYSTWKLEIFFFYFSRVHSVSYVLIGFSLSLSHSHSLSTSYFSITLYLLYLYGSNVYMLPGPYLEIRGPGTAKLPSYMGRRSGIEGLL